MTHYLFVDGNCLRARLRQIAERYVGNSQLTLFWPNLGGGYRKVFYYDALPCPKPNQSAADFNAELHEIETLHAFIATVDKFRVNEGHTRFRSGRGREQKGVDVMIAVDMLIHTIRRNMDEATLLAGDADFKPLLDGLSNEGMFVTLLHPPRASKELLASADARKPISVRTLFNWLDQASRTKFGAIPTPQQSTNPGTQNCVQALSVDLPEGTFTVWHELTNDTIRVLWPQDEFGSYHILYDAKWKNMRLILEDDYGVCMPEELGAQFAAAL